MTRPHILALACLVLPSAAVWAALSLSHVGCQRWERVWLEERHCYALDTVPGVRVCETRPRAGWEWVCRN